VSVDYRLSPENNYPAALDDLQSAWEWVLAHPRLSLERSAVGGDSAGGNLISALVVRLAAAKLPSPRLQVLIYPILDLTLRGASHRTFASGFGLCAASMRHFCSLYLGDGDGDDATLKKNPEVSPLFFGGLSALPPTLVISAEADPLVSEAGSFVRKLQGAGVEVGHVTYKGTVHAFLTYFEIFPEAAEAVEEIAGFLRKGWGLGLAAK
jgi:acetyl esterase